MFLSKTDPWTGSSSRLALSDGARIAVVGGGPAGSFFSFFLLALAERIDLKVELDLYEPRDFSRTGPPGCNMCGGIVSESLVQVLAAEGINLPPSVIQRGIDAYVLHTDEGSVRIETPLSEKRIGAVHRGRGPKRAANVRWQSFDAFLQGLAVERGARLVQAPMTEVRWRDGRPCVRTKDGTGEVYDLLAVATGVNSTAPKLLQELGLGYVPPRTTKTAICEYLLGEDAIDRHLGTSMHVFLLDIPRLEFAALIPKGDYVTACLLGTAIDAPLVNAFLTSPETTKCFPAGWRSEDAACGCWPNISVRGAVRPFADRVVFIGDCGVTRLYKDGIGAAYRTAKAAASTTALHGVSADDFGRHFLPTCRAIERDNTLGRIVFLVTHLIQKFRFTRRALVRMVAREQRMEGRKRRMSTVLWDLFTGSAPYREALLRSLHPAFLGRLSWHTMVVLVRGRRAAIPEEAA